MKENRLYLLIAAVSLLVGVSTATATVIVLNGPSSSGKTTLAYALQLACTERNIPTHLFSFDEYRAKKNQSYGKQRQTPANTTTTLVDMWVKEVTAATQKIDHLVIIENCFYVKKNSFEPIRQFCEKHAIALRAIKVTCSKEVAAERFKTRNDSLNRTERRSKLLMQQHYNDHELETIYAGMDYAYVIDTSTKLPRELAEELLIAMASILPSKQTAQLQK